MARFNNFSKTFLILLYCIPLKDCEGYNTIYDIIQNLELHEVRTLLIKDSQFVSYITNSVWKLGQAKIKSVTSSNQFKLPVKEINPWQLREFLLIVIDRVYKKEIPFTCFFL